MNYYKNFQNHFSSAAVADFLKSKPDDKLDTIKNLFVEYQLILGEYKYFRFLPNTSSKSLIRFYKDDDNDWKKYYIIDEIDYDWTYEINENGIIEMTAYKYRKFRKNLEKDNDALIFRFNKIYREIQKRKYLARKYSQSYYHN